METTITKAQIRAMKKADVICFRTVDDISYVECSQESNLLSYLSFSVSTKHKSIQSIHGDEGNRRCFSYHPMYTWDFCPVKTVISLLREGDTIILVWYKDAGNNEELKKDAMISDHFYVEIKRKDKIKYNFLIKVSTGKDNSGRMIRS